MAVALCIPRVNTNDDVVILKCVLVQTGTRVAAGDIVAEVETDKASVTVAAECDGYVLDIRARPGESIDVGSVLLWLGDTAGERAPETDDPDPVHETSAEPTLKAAMLIARHGLDRTRIPASGARLSERDVESFLARQQQAVIAADMGVDAGKTNHDDGRIPNVPGRLVRLSAKQRAMLRTVSWSGHDAASGYLEIRYDADAWQRHAEAFQTAYGMILNPLLALMAWQLGQIAKDQPSLNRTIVDGSEYLYDQVNLGFTVQSTSTLYLVVVRGAQDLSPRAFCDRLTHLQRAAMRDSLGGDDVSGCTLAFTSMARWNDVVRHVPVLPRHTALIVAHTGHALLGATYDHRLLTGAEVVGALQRLGSPLEESPASWV